LQKVESLGADALIAVNNLAGGHRGNLAPEALIKELNLNTHYLLSLHEY
jgi:nitronate monooxygenase